MTHPDPTDAVGPTFADLGLSPALLETVTALGYEEQCWEFYDESKKHQLMTNWGAHWISRVDWCNKIYHNWDGDGYTLQDHIDDVQTENPSLS